MWQTPELVEGLLPFLDPASTLELALAHKKTRSILKGSRVWKHLIKRSSPVDLDVVDHLVAIMKLMKDARGHILDLLVSICDPTSWDQDPTGSRYPTRPELFFQVPDPSRPEN